MQVTFTVPNNVGLAVKAFLASVCVQDGSMKIPSATIVSSDEAPKRRGRPTKEEQMAKLAAEKKTAKDADDDDELDTEDEEKEDPSDDEDDEEAEDDDEEETDAPIEGDDLKKLKSALRACSDAHGKDKATKALFKFAKTSMQVKKSQLPLVLKALKAVK